MTDNRIIEATIENTLYVSFDRRTVDASELGLKPGEWPERIQATLGNGRDFLRWRRRTDGGWEYIQEYGVLWLHIWND